MSSSTDTRNWLARYVLCVLLLTVSFVLFPIFALAIGQTPAASVLPRVLRNLLFFWPQYFLLLGGLEDRATGVRHLVGVATVLSLTGWLGLLAGYAWLTRGLKLVYVLVGLFPLLGMALEVVLALVLRSAGLAAVLDGP